MILILNTCLYNKNNFLYFCYAYTNGFHAVLRKAFGKDKSNAQKKFCLVY